MCWGRWPRFGHRFHGTSMHISGNWSVSIVWIWFVFSHIKTDTIPITTFRGWMVMIRGWLPIHGWMMFFLGWIHSWQIKTWTTYEYFMLHSGWNWSYIGFAAVLYISRLISIHFVAEFWWKMLKILENHKWLHGFKKSNLFYSMDRHTTPWGEEMAPLEALLRFRTNFTMGTSRQRWIKEWLHWFPGCQMELQRAHIEYVKYYFRLWNWYQSCNESVTSDIGCGHLGRILFGLNATQSSQLRVCGDHKPTNL